MGKYLLPHSDQGDLLKHINQHKQNKTTFT